ncbi:MAG: methylated-DNA--[protein]-cysteine S-methyltransferase [Anaerolineales bacterium]|nr:methylated-DNA--[protein]-cysteine S-methyltransferase [Anaerolineae bacterium]PWB50295.1 MAG: methylated-DNA--[protein]-cysteine S-methyltransferase [Anaerolineales bacterium]
MPEAQSVSNLLSTIAIGKLSSSPIGPLWIAVTTHGLVRVEWDMSVAEFINLVSTTHAAPVIYDDSRTSSALQQLSEYLQGTRRQFTIPLDLASLTSFQCRVLQLTAQIPYGQTLTYKDLAVQVGKPKAARAVGRVEATNPIPLVIPCHRVLGSDGSLHGYGGPGGIKLKAWLLDLEHSAV